MKPPFSMVVLHDDEYCLRPRVLQSICEDTIHSNSSLYAGNKYWQTAEFEGQKGHDGSFAPYFSGHMYSLSSDLIRSIVLDPATIFTSTTTGFAEDVQVGRWVQNQVKNNEHPREIEYMSMNHL